MAERRKPPIRRFLPTPEARAFATWGAGSYAVVTVLLLVLALRRTGGRMLYVLAANPGP